MKNVHRGGILEVKRKKQRRHIIGCSFCSHKNIEMEVEGEHNP